MTHDIFISYSNKNKQVADSICEFLEQNGVRCWIAPRDIVAGKEYGDIIDDAIKNCKLFVIVFSNESRVSSWVKSELNLAFTDKREIIPFKIDTSPLEGEMRLLLNNRHWIDAYPKPELKYQELLNSVYAFLGISEIQKRRIEEETKNLEFEKEKLNQERIRLEELKQKIEERQKFVAQRDKIIEEQEKIKIQLEDKKINDPVTEVFSMGLNSFKGTDKIVQDYFASVEYFREAAERGNADAQYYLGYCYSKGYGVAERDLKNAFHWSIKAANQGHKLAQYYVGCCCLYGQGVEKNYFEAARWFTKSANSGIVKAQCKLAFLYELGRGVPKNRSKAIELYTIAAKNGYSYAYFQLGNLYEKGSRIEKNKPLALEYYLKAYNNGYKPALYAYKKLKRGCFITTAVCQYQNKLDNCLELETLRWFRDNWLIHQKDGKQLINEYYSIAPTIVQKIDNMNSRDKIYKLLDQKYISVCVKWVKEQKYCEAKNLYIEMMDYLKMI